MNVDFKLIWHKLVLQFASWILVADLLVEHVLPSCEKKVKMMPQNHTVQAARRPVVDTLSSCLGGISTNYFHLAAGHARVQDSQRLDARPSSHRYRGVFIDHGPT